MSFDEFQQVVAIAGAIGASVGGLASFLINWWWKVREQADSILVRYGPSRYEQRPGVSMHVISRRKHKMDVTDYGFVLASGKLQSLPMLWEEYVGDDGIDDFVGGSSSMNGLNEIYEVNVQLRDEGIVGAYARTATQRALTVDFSRWDTTWADRLRLRLRLLYKREFV